MPALAAPLLTESALGSLSAACGCAVASSGTVRSLCRRERPATPPSPPSDPHPTPPRFALSWSPSLSRQTRLVSERLGAVSASSLASFCLPVSHRRDAHAGALAAAASPLGFGGLFARRARLTRRHDRHESCSAQAFPRRGWHLLPLSSTASSLSSSVAALLHWSRFRPASRFAAPTSLFAAASLDMLPAGLQRALTAREGLSGAAEASPGFAFALTQRRAFGSRRAKTVKQISYRALRRAINEFKQSELREHPREAASAFLIPAASSRLLPGEGATKALSDRPRLADSASLPLRPPSAADLRSSYADPLKYSTSLVPAPLPSPPPVLFQRTVTLPASPEKDLQLRARRLPLGNVKKLKSFELTAALCTYAQVYVHHAALWTALVKECDGRSEQFSPSEACWVLHAFAQAKARREKTSGAPRHAGADSAPDGASLRRASSRLCTHIARHFRFLSLPDAARALHAVSVLQLPDVRLFRLLWPLLPELLEEFRSQHLAADSSPQRAHRVLQLLVAALAHENAPHADVLRAAGDVYTSHINRWVDAQLQRMRQEKKRLRRRSRALAGSRSGGAVGATEGAQVEPGPGDADDKETSVIFRLSDLGDKSPLEQMQHKGAGASASEQDVDALLPMPRRLAAVLEAFARLQYRHEPLIAATLRLFQLSSASQPRPSTPVSAASDGAAAARPLQPSSALFQRGLEAAATAPSLQRPEDSFCPDRGAHVHPGGIGAPEALSSVSLNPYPALPAGVPPYRRSESRGGRERDGGGNCLPLTSSLSLGSLSSSVSQPTCLLAPSSPRGAAPTSASVLVPRVGSSAFPPVSVDSSQSRALSRRRTGVSLPWTGEAAVARALCLSPRALMRRKRDEGRNPASVSASPLSLQLKRFGFAGSPWQLPLGERHKRHALAGKLRKRVDWRRMLHETLASNVLPGRRSPFLSSKLERSKTKSAVLMQQIEARRAESAALAFRQRQKPWVAADLGTALVALEALGVKSLGLVQLWKHEVYANLHRLSHSETLDALETARRVGWYSRAFGQRAFARVAWCLKPERGGIRDANELVRAGLLLADWSNSDKEMQEVTRTVKKKMAAIGRQWLMEEEGEDALREVCRHLERLGHIPPPSASLQLSRSLAHSPATAASSHLRLSASGAGPLSTGAALPAVSQLTSPRDAASSARSDSADASAFLSSADALSSSGVCRGPSHLLPQSAQRPARAGSWPCPRRLPLRGLAGIFPWRPIEAISSEAVAPALFPALLHITVSLFPTSPPIPLELLLPRIRQCAVGAAVSLNTVHDMLRDLNALQQFRAVAHRSPARVCRPNWVHSGVSSVASLARRAPASTFFSPAAAASPSSFISPCSSPRGPGYSSTASLACAKEAEPRAGIPRDGQDPREAILDRTEAALWRVARQRVRRAVAAVSENGMSGGAAGSDAPDAGEALASPSLQAGVPREEKRAVGLDALRQTDVTLEALARHGAMLISLKNAAVEASAFQPRQSCQPDAGERDTCSPATASGSGAPGALAPSSPGNVERKSPQAPVSSPEREMQQGCGEKGSWQEGRPARCVEGAARAEREAESVAVLNAVRRSIRMPPALRNTSQGGQDAARHSGANEPRLGEGWTPQNVKEAVAVLSLEAAPYTAGLLRPEPCLSRRVCRTPRNLEQNPSNSTSCRNCGHDAQGGPDEFDRHDVMPVSPRRRALPPACACLGAGPAEEGSCRQPWQPARKSAERAAPNRGQPSPSGDGRGDASKEDPPPTSSCVLWEPAPDILLRLVHFFSVFSLFAREQEFCQCAQIVCAFLRHPVWLERLGDHLSSSLQKVTGTSQEKTSAGRRAASGTIEGVPQAPSRSCPEWELDVLEQMAAVGASVLRQHAHFIVSLRADDLLVLLTDLRSTSRLVRRVFELAVQGGCRSPERTSANTASTSAATRPDGVPTIAKESIQMLDMLFGNMLQFVQLAENVASNILRRLRDTPSLLQAATTVTALHAALELCEPNRRDQTRATNKQRGGSGEHDIAIEDVAWLEEAHGYTATQGGLRDYLHKMPQTESAQRGVTCTSKAPGNLHKASREGHEDRRRFVGLSYDTVETLCGPLAFYRIPEFRVRLTELALLSATYPQALSDASATSERALPALVEGHGRFVRDAVGTVSSSSLYSGDSPEGCALLSECRLPVRNEREGIGESASASSLPYVNESTPRVKSRTSSSKLGMAVLRATLESDGSCREWEVREDGAETQGIFHRTLKPCMPSAMRRQQLAVARSTEWLIVMQGTTGSLDPGRSTAETASRVWGEPHETGRRMTLEHRSLDSIVTSLLMLRMVKEDASVSMILEGIAVAESALASVLL